MSSLGKDKLIFDPADAAETDNVGAYLRASDGTLLTHTTVGGAQALDVSIKSASGQYAEDAAHVSGDIGSFMLAVRNDANAALTSADGDYSPVAVDSAGRLKVIASLTIDAQKAEDSAHVSGDIGSFSLAVRQDALASSVSADGDYGAFKLDARGALWTAAIGTAADDAADSEAPVKIGSRSVSGAALTTVSANNDRADLISDKYRRVWINDSANVGLLSAAAGVADSAAALVATAMAGRRSVMVQNLGSKAIFVGDAAVTTATGIRVSAGATVDIDLGENVSLFAIAAVAGPQDVRVLEVG